MPCLESSASIVSISFALSDGSSGIINPAGAGIDEEINMVLPDATAYILSAWSREAVRGAVRGCAWMLAGVCAKTDIELQTIRETHNRKFLIVLLSLLDFSEQTSALAFDKDSTSRHFIQQGRGAAKLFSG